MDLTSLLLAPVRLPLRLIKLADDIGVIAEHSGRDPDPVEEVRDRFDLALAELAMVAGMAKEIVEGGAELTQVARHTHATMYELLELGRALLPVVAALEVTGERIKLGGEDLNQTGRTLDAHTVELIDGGARLTAVSEQLEADLRVFRAALPRLLQGLDMVEQLEGAVETVADTVEPLQGAAERVGRVTQRLSRSR
jgi:hypothetical protein